MRGESEAQLGFTVFTDLEDRIPFDHPLRPLGRMVDKALCDISSDIEDLYSKNGRPSIAPEILLRAWAYPDSLAPYLQRED